MASNVCRIFLWQAVVANVANGFSFMQLQVGQERGDIDNSHASSVVNGGKPQSLILNMSTQPHVPGNLPTSLHAALIATGKRSNISEITEQMYQEMASLRNDDGMAAFVKIVLAADNKYVPTEDEPKLAAMVPWYSGAKATQSLAALRHELLSKDWVKDLQDSFPNVAAVDTPPKTGVHPPVVLKSIRSKIGAVFTEDQYQQVAALRDDAAMNNYAQALLAAENKFIAKKDENELAGFAQWFSGTKATQTLAKMRRELAGKSWVKNMQPVLGAPRVTEDHYQALAALKNDAAMIALVRKLLKSENKFVPEEEESELAGFVQWFSGTKATQSLAQMLLELRSKSWVKVVQAPTAPVSGTVALVGMTGNPEALDVGASITEADYQQKAAVRDDAVMTSFIKKVLASEHKFVPQQEELELAGFVPWFSGTKATQSLQQMRQELSTKSWVKPMIPPPVVVANSSSLSNSSNTTQKRTILQPAPATVRTNSSLKGAKSVVTNSIPSSKATGKLGVTLGAAQKDKLVQKPLFEGRANSTCAECIIWGWSRILSFNSFRTRVAKISDRKDLIHDEMWKEGMYDSKQGNYWLVQSPSVQIGARYAVNESHPEFTALQAISVSGPFLGGNRLVINTLSRPVTWNGKGILNAMPSDFANQFVTARYLKQSELVQSGAKAPAVELSFSNGMFLVVNRWVSTLAARIHMCETHVGTEKLDGQCGNLAHSQPGQTPVLPKKASTQVSDNHISNKSTSSGRAGTSNRTTSPSGANISNRTIISSSASISNRTTSPSSASMSNRTNSSIGRISNKGMNLSTNALLQKPMNSGSAGMSKKRAVSSSVASFKTPVSTRSISSERRGKSSSNVGLQKPAGSGSASSSKQRTISSSGKATHKMASSGNPDISKKRTNPSSRGLPKQVGPKGFGKHSTLSPP